MIGSRSIFEHAPCHRRYKGNGAVFHPNKHVTATIDVAAARLRNLAGVASPASVCQLDVQLCTGYDVRHLLI